MTIYGKAEFNIEGITKCLALNWFVRAYIILYIFSPVLNKFIDHADKKELKTVLLSFFCFQTIYSFATNWDFALMSGYSPLSFMGLYLLARYANIYRPLWTSFSIKKYAAIFTASTLIIAVIGYFAMRHDLINVSNQMFAYANPLVIVSALSLLLSFSQIHIKSKAVNWCAASCLAVFLLIAHPNVFDTYFKPMAVLIYGKTSGIEYLICIFMYMIFISVLAILIDKIRMFLWEKTASLCVQMLKQRHEH